VGRSRVRHFAGTVAPMKILPSAAAAVILGACLSASVSASAATPPTVYYGKTSQRQNMEFRLSATRKLVTLARTPYKLTCGNRPPTTRRFGVSRSEKIAVRSTGRFLFTAKSDVTIPDAGPGTVRISFSGAVTSKTVKGSFSINIDFESGTKCHSGNVTFTLRPPPRGVA
jgi:hypothetical protein